MENGASQKCGAFLLPFFALVPELVEGSFQTIPSKL
jgi:hypothetical protein